jgi:hypothetical protein
LTYRNNLSRTGANLNETTLTPSNVNRNTFGLLFSYAVDGEVYAQPLYMSNVTLPDGSVHNLVFVETEHDSVYAFDANNPTAGPNGNGILWKDSFIDPANGVDVVVPSDVGCDKFSSEIGITDTPVINPSSGIMYFVAYTRETGRTFHQRLHALDITTGKEALGGPVEIQATYPGTADGGDTLTFNPLDQLERAGLVLAGGVVYTSWSSHCDHPAHGWLIGYDAHTLRQVVVFNTSPNASLATIWSGAPAVDADGNLFFVTGNGDTTGGEFNPSLGDYPETVLKLSTASGQPAVADYFTPANWDALDQADEDLGSGAAMLLPDQAGPIAHLLIVAGKEGTIYLINHDNMGQFNAASDRVVQEVTDAVRGQGAYGTPTYFDAGAPNQRWIYFAGWGDYLRAFQLSDDGTLSTSSTSQSGNQFTAPHGAILSLSANGTRGGIVWAIDASDTAVLYAFDATNLANELYDSSQAGTRDQLHAGVKFSVPTIADGEVFVGATYALSVFGLLPGGNAAPAKRSRSAIPLDPAIVQLPRSLDSQVATVLPGNIRSQNAMPVDPVVLQPLTQPPLEQMSPAAPGSIPRRTWSEQQAKDTLFAREHSVLDDPSPAGPWSVYGFDL